MKSNAAAPRRSKLALFWIVLHTATVLLGLLTLATFAARWSWYAELLCHFRAQFALCAGLALAVYVLGRRFFAAECTVVLFAYLLWGLFPYWLPTTNVAANEAGSRPLRIVSFNVYIYNDRYQDVIDFVRAADPDMVAFYEVSSAWHTGLAPLSADYPHQRSFVSEGSFGFEIFSRVPLDNPQFHQPVPPHPTLFTAQISVGGQDNIALFAVHPPPPIDAELVHLRQATFEKLTAELSRTTGPAVVIGDFNCTPWSPLLADLCRQEKLVDGRLGRGLQPTWPTWLPRLMQIPIDFCLVRELAIASQEPGPDCHSDHCPLVVELQVPKQPAAQQKTPD